MLLRSFTLPRSPRFPQAALVATAILSLAACGGGGRGGGLAAPRPSFVAPSATTNVAIGGSFDVRLVGVAPGSQVILRLDADGDLSTTNDQYALGAPLTASSAGEIETLASTDLGSHMAPGALPAGTYVLFASEAAGPAVAIARGAVNLRSSSFTRLLEGAQNGFDTVAALSDGRIAVAGTVSSAGTFSSQGVPAAFDGTDGEYGLVALYGSSGDLVTAWPLKAPSGIFVNDMTAGPDGGFTLAGYGLGGLTSIAGAVPGAAESGVPAIDGASVGFEASYGPDAGLLGSTFAESAGAAGGAGLQNPLCFSAVATAKDGSRYGVLEGVGDAAVNGGGLSASLGGWGLEVVRTAADGGPIGGFLALSGAGYARGIAVLADGDLLICGARGGIVTFAPGRAGEKTAASGQLTPFVARFRSDGSLVALFEPATPGWAYPYGFAARPDGSCCIVGEVRGPIAFAPGMTVDPSTHQSDGFVASLDARLMPIWVRPWKADGAPDAAALATAWCASVAALPGGSCVVSGSTWYFATADDATIGSGEGVESDSMIVRYNAAGDIEWDVTVAGPNVQRIDDVAVDANGAIVAAGRTQGPTLITDRDGKVTTLVPTLQDVQSGLLIRLDADGRLR